MTAPSPDTLVRLPEAKVTLPGTTGFPEASRIDTPLSARVPNGARRPPACVIAVALMVRLPPADSGTVGSETPAGEEIVTEVGSGVPLEPPLAGRSWIAKAVAVVG